MIRFIIGFAIGAAAGAAAVYFTAPRSGSAQRQELKSLWDSALDVGRQAAEAQTSELWKEYQARIDKK